MWSFKVENKISRCQLCWTLHRFLVSGSRGEGKILVQITQLSRWYFDYQKYIIWVEIDPLKILLLYSLFIIYTVMHGHTPFCLVLWGKCLASFTKNIMTVLHCVRGKTCNLLCIRLSFCIMCQKDKQSLLHMIWLLFCTMSQSEGMQSLLCRIWLLFCTMWEGRRMVSSLSDDESAIYWNLFLCQM